MIDNENINEQLEKPILEPIIEIKEDKKKKYEIYISIFKFILLCLSIVIIAIPYSKKSKSEEPSIGLVNLYINTHKDFANNLIYNPAYKILCDDLSQIKNEYKIKVIPTNENNTLYQKRVSYCEGAKMHYIWQLYKTGNITSKYVGFFHYRRLFDFKNDIPDLDSLFKNYDVLLPQRMYFPYSMYDQFKKSHIVHFLDEAIEIIKDKYPEYYPSAKSFFQKKWANFCNIFIMKKEDFIKWGDFVYGVMYEVDKKNNFTTDADVRNLITKEINKCEGTKDINYQSRIGGYVLERLSNVFYDKHFQKRKEIKVLSP